MRSYVRVGVLAFALSWPLVHRAAVERFDLNPWKFGGFAMYCTPAPPVLVLLLEPVRGGFRPIEPSGFSPALARELERFQMRRHALGVWESPEGLASAVLAERPELNAISVMVQRMKLDRASARMTSRRDHYIYDRTGLIRAWEPMRAAAAGEGSGQP